MKKSKFKVGDEVVLSASGSRISENLRYKGGSGKVVAIIDDGKAITLLCKWSNPSKGLEGNAFFKPYELKFKKTRAERQKINTTSKPKMYYKHNATIWS